MKKPSDELIATRPGLADQEVSAPRIAPPPRAYTRGLHEKIVENVLAGNRPQVAAKMAGITEQTFYRWMQAGKAGDPHLWEFAQDVELAEGTSEGEAVAVVKAAFKDDPENARWYLSTRFPRGWNKSANSLAQAQIEEFVRTLEAGLPPEIFEQVLAVIVGQSASLPETPPVKLLVVSKETT